MYLDELIRRLEFLVTCDYAKFHPEFVRGVKESIRIVELFKERNGN